jgi:hypothetical protein
MQTKKKPTIACGSSKNPRRDRNVELACRLGPIARPSPLSSIRTSVSPPRGAGCASTHARWICSPSTRRRGWPTCVSMSVGTACRARKIVRREQFMSTFRICCVRDSTSSSLMGSISASLDEPVRSTCGRTACRGVSGTTRRAAWRLTSFNRTGSISASLDEHVRSGDGRAARCRLPGNARQALEGRM